MQSFIEKINSVLAKLHLNFREGLLILVFIFVLVGASVYQKIYIYQSSIPPYSIVPETNSQTVPVQKQQPLLFEVIFSTQELDLLNGFSIGIKESEKGSLQEFQNLIKSDSRAVVDLVIQKDADFGSQNRGFRVTYNDFSVLEFENAVKTGKQITVRGTTGSSNYSYLEDRSARYNIAIFLGKRNNSTQEVSSTVIGKGVAPGFKRHDYFSQYKNGYQEKGFTLSSSSVSSTLLSFDFTWKGSVSLVGNYVYDGVGSPCFDVKESDLDGLPLINTGIASLDSTNGCIWFRNELDPGVAPLIEELLPGATIGPEKRVTISDFRQQNLPSGLSAVLLSVE